MDPDGSNLKPLRTNDFYEYQASLSPDGSKIVFVSNMDGDFEVYMMNLDGSHLQKITDNEHLDFAPTWSADGNKLAYLSSTTGSKSTDIWITDADGKNPINATPVRYLNGPKYSINISSISFSPDGQKLALSVGSFVKNIAIQNVDGTGYVNFGDRLIGQWDHVDSPVWSKDGTKILFTNETIEAEPPGMDGDVIVATVSPDGSNYQEIYRTKAVEIGSARFSPDESEVIFLRSVPGPSPGYETDYDYTTQLFKIKINGQDLKQITEKPINISSLDDWK